MGLVIFFKETSCLGFSCYWCFCSETSPSRVRLEHWLIYLVLMDFSLGHLFTFCGTLQFPVKSVWIVEGLILGEVYWKSFPL